MIKILQLGFEALLILAILVFAYTQLMRPLMTKTPVFPMFRKRPNLERQMEETTEALADKAQKKVLAQAQEKLGVGTSGNSNKKSK